MSRKLWQIGVQEFMFKDSIQFNYKVLVFVHFYPMEMFLFDFLHIAILCVCEMSNGQSDRLYFWTKKFCHTLDFYFHQLKLWYSDMKFTGHHHCMYWYILEYTSTWVHEFLAATSSYKDRRKMVKLNKFLKTFNCLVVWFTTGSLIYLMLDLTAKETSNQDIYFKQVIKTGKVLFKLFGISNHTLSENMFELGVNVNLWIGYCK